MVLLFYIPHWSPPPALSIEDAHRLQVPSWFVNFRWLLIPRDYFKGITIMLKHVLSGHLAYLHGQWSEKRLVVLLSGSPSWSSYTGPRYSYCSSPPS